LTMPYPHIPPYIFILNQGLHTDLFIWLALLQSCSYIYISSNPTLDRRGESGEEESGAEDTKAVSLIPPPLAVAHDESTQDNDKRCQHGRRRQRQRQRHHRHCQCQLHRRHCHHRHPHRITITRSRLSPHAISNADQLRPRRADKREGLMRREVGGLLQAGRSTRVFIVSLPPSVVIVTAL
jgi:hypothetical protein